MRGRGSCSGDGRRLGFVSRECIGSGRSHWWEMGGTRLETPLTSPHRRPNTVLMFVFFEQLKKLWQ
jgi:hypothetical protein